MPVINYSIEKPSPIPYERMCHAALGVKTVNNWYLGNPQKLKNLSKKLSIDLVSQENTEGVSYKDIGIAKTLLYTIFEYIPKRILGQEPSDLYSLYFGECKPVLSDMPIVIGLLKWDFPSYSFILGKRRNVFFSKDNTCSSIDSSLYPVLSEKPVRIYAYNSYGFAFPNQKLSKGFHLVINVTNDKKVLVLIYKDNTLYNAFLQKNVLEKLTESGDYDIYIYNYAFRIWKFFFGLRLLSCAQDFKVLD